MACLKWAPLLAGRTNCGCHFLEQEGTINDHPARPAPSKVVCVLCPCWRAVCCRPGPRGAEEEPEGRKQRGAHEGQSLPRQTSLPVAGAELASGACVGTEVKGGKIFYRCPLPDSQTASGTNRRTAVTSRYGVQVALTLWVEMTRDGGCPVRANVLTVRGAEKNSMPGRCSIKWSIGWANGPSPALPPPDGDLVLVMVPERCCDGGPRKQAWSNACTTSTLLLQKQRPRAGGQAQSRVPQKLVISKS